MPYRKVKGMKSKVLLSKDEQGGLCLVDGNGVHYFWGPLMV